MNFDPWLPGWNYAFFQMLFRWIPRHPVTDHYAALLILHPILTTWPFAAAFYWYWKRNVPLRTLRRSYLLSSVAAFALAVFLTLVLRPWIHWPAPALNPRIRSLFQSFPGGNYTWNCFPSHSTLAYSMAAGSFWPMNRWLSVCLYALALLFVSIPRIYVGGHYPIDVVFSCALGILALAAGWTWFPSRISRSLYSTVRPVRFIWESVCLLWVFELADGFRSLESLSHLLRRVNFQL